jgi:hypothetical protein
MSVAMAAAAPNRCVNGEAMWTPEQVMNPENLENLAGNPTSILL